MIYGAIAAFELGVIIMAVVVVLLMSTNSVFADSYKKTQIISQVNECGNYWFPVNIICSNFNSHAQGDKNDAETTDSQSTDSNKNYGTPFP
jgi:hypothetical protein